MARSSRRPQIASRWSGKCGKAPQRREKGRDPFREPPSPAPPLAVDDHEGIEADRRVVDENAAVDLGNVERPGVRRRDHRDRAGKPGGMPRSLAKWFKVPSGSTPSGNAGAGEGARDRMHAAVAAADDDASTAPARDALGRPHRRRRRAVAGHEGDVPPSRRSPRTPRRARGCSSSRCCRSAVPEAGFTSATTLSPDAAGCAGASTVSMLVLTRSGGLAVCGASTLMSRRCHVQEKLCRAAPAQKGFQVGSPVNLR